MLNLVAGVFFLWKLAEYFYRIKADEVDFDSEPVGLLAAGKLLVETVGGDFVSGWVDEGMNEVTGRLFGETGQLNHDVARVLGESLGLAAAEVKQGLRRNHTFYRLPNQANLRC